MLSELLGAKRLRFTNAQRRRLARKGKVVGGRRLLGCIVTPDTILRWYRQLVANKYDGGSKRRPGRPPQLDQLRSLILTVARDNPSWGYTRLRDVMRSLGHEVGRTTIQQLLQEHGLEPAPRRQRHLSWREFLRAH